MDLSYFRHDLMTDNQTHIIDEEAKNITEEQWNLLLKKVRTND